MTIKIDYNSIYIYWLLFLVLGMSSIAGLNFLYEISFNYVYNTVFAALFILFIGGLFVSKLNLLLNNYIRLLIIFFIVVTLSYLFNSSGETSDRKYFLFFGSGLILTIFSSALQPYSYKYLPQYFVFFALLNAFVMFGYLLKFGGVTELKWSMITQVGTDVIYISRTLGLGVLTVFFYLKNKLLKILISAIFLYFMIILNEVGPILAATLSIFIYYFRKNNLYLFLSILCGLIFYFFIIQKYVPDLTMEGILNDPRVEIYTKNFNYFINHPFFGIGIAGSTNIEGAYQSAHNIFLEIAVELGVIGLIPFLGMIMLLLNNFINNRDFLFGYLWFYSFIIVQFSGDFSLNSIFWFFSAIFMAIPVQHNLEFDIL